MFGSAIGKIVIGIVLALAGLLAMIFLDISTYGDVAVLLSWGLLLLGVIFFVAGVLQAVTHSVAGSGGGGEGKPGTGAERDYIVRTTLAMALADGKLDDKEIRISATVYKEVTGKEIGLDRVRELAGGMSGKGDALIGELKAARSRIPESTKLQIVKAAYLALAADGEVTSEEESRIGDVSQALGLSYDQASKAIREADQQATVLRAGRRKA